MTRVSGLKNSAQHAHTDNLTRVSTFIMECTPSSRSDHKATPAGARGITSLLLLMNVRIILMGMVMVRREVRSRRKLSTAPQHSIMAGA
ncbi:hypothetical protein BDR04DRAFT_1096640 [Suillus decipiens]|nr:hypothetical protein BDR04DRAFT_1096640 [Suillus decipiens]